jgi:hypothetical protein
MRAVGISASSRVSNAWSASVVSGMRRPQFPIARKTIEGDEDKQDDDFEHDLEAHPVPGSLLVIGVPRLAVIFSRAVSHFMPIAAGWEAGYVQAREYTRGYLAPYAMVTRFRALSPSRDHG